MVIRLHFVLWFLVTSNNSRKEAIIPIKIYFKEKNKIDHDEAN